MSPLVSRLQDLREIYLREFSAYVFARDGGAGDEWLAAIHTRLDYLEAQLEALGIEPTELL